MTGLVIVALAVFLLVVGVPLLGFVPALVIGIVTGVVGVVFVWLELS